MKASRLKRLGLSIFAALSLAVSSFAAPLCACLNVTAKTHDCCAKMKDHCPMKKHAGDSLDKTPRSGCACFAEKQENAPAKLSGSGKSQPETPALAPHIFAAALTVRIEPAQAVFAAPSFTGNRFSKQTSARAPPCL